MSLKITDNEYRELPGIYIIKNLITGKEYIGESLNIRRRMFCHRAYKGNQIIHKSIKKYGVDNFQVYCEYYPNFSKEDLLDLEENMIKQYNTLYPNGYNLSERGWNKLCDEYVKRPKNHGEKISKAKKGMIFSEEHRKSLSLAHTGKKLSLKHRESISKSSFGRVVSDETREKLKNNYPNKCAVIQLTMDGNLVNEYKSIREAERVTGINNAKISMVCKNKRNSAGNFKWIYK